MSHAEKCPICNGTGKINETENWSTIGTITFKKTCNGCEGRGWVTVYDPVDYITIFKGEKE